ERSDIYSLGVMLYELATGGLGPFTASRQNKDAVLAQVRAGQCLPLKTLAPDIPPVLAQIIERAVQFNPRHRQADAAELAAELEPATRRLQPGRATVAVPPRRRTFGLVLRVLAVLAPAVVALVVAKPWRSGAEGPGASGVNSARPDAGASQPGERGGGEAA